MNNTFLKEGSITPNASINNVYIKKMPVYNIEENLEGKYAGDIFSTQLIIDEIKKYHKELNINLQNIEERKLPQSLDKCLESDNVIVKKYAEKIAKLFGNRLALILLVLKTGLDENRKARKDWTNDYWEYWNQINYVIFTGGLASGNLGEKFKYTIDKLFNENNVKPYNLILNPDSQNIAIKGCATYIDNLLKDKLYLILDCGATFIKRSAIKFGPDEKLNITELNKLPSKYVECDYKTDEEEREEAVKMHNYIMNVIIDSLNEVSSSKNNFNDIGNSIIISIANYVNNGVFIKRGSYGKLRLLSHNYEEFLSDKIYEAINKRYTIRLVHDGTAMASAFNKYDDSVCISLGTRFGVGFPVRIE
ncbi:MAG TPA: hypothetical protein DG753_11420 [Clostridium sp.]|nr:hypothetical protein [Clostridium sp.]